MGTSAGRGRRRSGPGTATLATLAVFTFAACSAAPVAVTEHRSEVAYVGEAEWSWGPADQARNRALTRLGAELVATSPDQNVVVSPVSVLLAFAMLREGATGETAEQLDTMFAFDPEAPGEAVADLRAFLAAFNGDVSAVDRDAPPSDPLLHVADALFVAPDAGVTATFLDRVARFHDSGVFEADFQGGKAKPLLDAWVERETGGLVQEAPNAPDPTTKLSVLSAIVLAARWAHEFDSALTQPAGFTRPDGSTVEVETMHQLLETSYAAQDGWQAVWLPYTAGFAMILALPPAGQGALTAAQWDEVRGQVNPALELPESLVQLAVPHWDFDAKVDLKAALGPLGLVAPFEHRGDLDEVFPDAYVTAAVQSATITVAEQGTVAAAVTQLDVRAGSAPPEPNAVLRLDRPFDFQIVETSTMLPLFAGHVADPSQGR